MRKTLAGVALAFTVTALLPAGIGLAHDATATPSCTGLSWNAHNYDPEQTNSIVVTVDSGVVYSDPNFGSTDQGSHPWDQTVNHAWSVVVNAPGTDFDRNFNGTWQACVVGTTTTVTPTTTTVAATTTVAQTTTTIAGTTTTGFTVPSTTVVTDPTTTVAGPPVTIPRTGDDSGPIALLALGLVVAGAVAGLVSRRKSA